ncbi:MAG TPA: CDP-diacylglycerol--serine O-phosphatidyltransferase, partial [Longimicrobiales bacterium]
MSTRLQRGIIIVPSALTLGNLLFGLWAMVSASRNDFTAAAWLIVWAAIFDTVDGRVARYTQTGSRFGEELDSLVDAISFGVAPAFIIYFLFLTGSQWGWFASFFYVTGAVIRLARFNVEQAGHAKAVFHGLPSPSAGILLATYYPFSQTPLFHGYFAQWAWPTIMTAALFVIPLLMMSHVPYAVMPKFGFTNFRGFLVFAFLMLCIVLALWVPDYFFFPMAVAYIGYGVLKALMLGFFERLPEQDPLLDVEEGDEAGAELRDISYEGLGPRRHLRLPRVNRRRR